MVFMYEQLVSVSYGVRHNAAGHGLRRLFFGLFMKTLVISNMLLLLFEISNISRF